jgi:DNA-binding NarL/FixJ family response regulator
MRSQLAHADGTPLRVLVVDDDAFIRLDLEQTLREHGAAVVGEASTGKQAIALAEQHRPDIVLMDIRIDGDMDGIDAAQRILDRLDIAVVFVSADGDHKTRARIAALKGPDLLLKPASSISLVTAIRRACRL